LAPRSLEQVMAELDPGFAGSRKVTQERLAAIPGQVAAEEQGLEAKQERAFTGIVDAARRRGLGFSGIPIGEQAQYTSTEYLPSLARLRGQARDQELSLQESLSGLDREQRTQALGIRGQEQALAEQARQFDLQQRAASAARATPTFGGDGGAPAGGAIASQRGDKGFDFRDAGGQPISAAAYAAAKGVPFRQVLQTMADAGDQGAAQALGFVGDDFGYDPGKVTDRSMADLYNALVWGTGRQAEISANMPGLQPVSKNLGGLAGLRILSGVR
jgi:hypothetical protein